MNVINELVMKMISCYMHDKELEGSLSFLTNEQWQKLHDFSKMHYLSPIVYEVVKNNDSFKQLPDLFKNQWKQETISLVIKQVQLSEAFLKIYQEIRKTGINCIVTKGIVLRQLYSKREWRVSGDEDIFIKKEDFKKVHQIFIDRNYHVINDIANENIPVITYVDPITDLNIELHLQLFGKDTYLGFLNDYFKDSFDHCMEIEIDNVFIQVMNENDQLFYLICHCFKHFINNGVGLRQLMDIGMYSQKYYSMIDWFELLHKTNNFKGNLFVHCIYSILEDFFNVSMNSINYPKQLINNLDYHDILEDIFDSGVFGLSSEERIYSNLVTRRVINKEHKKIPLLELIFPSAKKLRSGYAVLYDHPYLLPYIWIKRILRFLIRYNSSRKNSNLDITKSVVLGNERIALLKKYHIID